LRSLGEVGYVALLANVGEYLAGLAVSVAGLRTGLGEVGSIDVYVAGTRKHSEGVIGRRLAVAVRKQ
jgi:hypothetical protein